MQHIEDCIFKNLKIFRCPTLKSMLSVQLTLIMQQDPSFYNLVLLKYQFSSLNKLKKADLQQILSFILVQRLNKTKYEN